MLWLIHPQITLFLIHLILTQWQPSLLSFNVIFNSMLKQRQFKKSTTTSTFLQKLLGSCSQMLLLCPLNLMLTSHPCFFYCPSHLAQRWQLKIFAASSCLVLRFLNICVWMATLVLTLSKILRLASSKLWPSSLERLLNWRKQCADRTENWIPMDYSFFFNIILKLNQLDQYKPLN